METRPPVHRRLDRPPPLALSAAAVMWAGIAGSVTLLLVLLARGWGGDAWSLAAGVLFIVCLGVCVGSAIATERSARAVDDAVDRLVAARRAARRAGQERVA